MQENSIDLTAISLRIAADTITEYKLIPMTGTLNCRKDKAYASLEVSQDLVDSSFEALKKEFKDIEKSPNNAHISVIDKTDGIKGDWPIKEDGKTFTFYMGELHSCEPDDWEGVKKVWFINCKSKELEKLREKHGLTPLLHKDHNFHISVAIQKTKVARIANRIVSTME